ncbi:cupin domain-containing protein [Metapseudomonas furukawaii]|uniref:cupin domain-containing protein n=1 Tax=Metapseudomonas furukawaii TaxID=1149133 RepID=UPI0040457C10
MPEACLDSSAPRIYGARGYSDLVDWGTQSDPVKGLSHSSGRLLFKGPNNRPETGLWVCTPGTWRLSIPRDELCHFLAGRAIYRSDDGEVIHVGPDTLVMFPAGWTGECEVQEVLRNVYMLV